jgi:hypothetical protein
MMGLALVAALSVASAASAQEVASVEVAGSSATSRPFYVGLGIGGVFGVSGGSGSGMFRIEEDIGYHVWSTGNHPGLFVGLLANQAFRSSYLWADILARIGFDFNVYDWGSGRLLIAPSVAAGVALTHFSFTDPWTGNSASDTTALFDMIISAELRAVLVDGLLSIWFRPIGLEIAARDGAGVNWDLNAGVLFNF